MTQERQNINIRSQEIQEILGIVPGRLTRFGSALILITFLSAFAMTALIWPTSYKEFSVVITNPQTAVGMLTNEPGIIEKVFVASQDKVKKGQLLILLSNDANLDEMFSLEAKLDSLLDSPEFEHLIEFPTKPGFGAINENYLQFLKTLNKPIISLKQNDKVYIESAQVLRKAISVWKEKYLMIAPNDGLIIFTEDLSKGDTIHVGEVLYTLGQNNKEILVNMFLSPLDLNQLDTSEVLEIKLNDFSSSKYGYLKAKVAYLPKPSSNKAIDVSLSLLEGLITSKGQALSVEESKSLHGSVVIAHNKASLFSNIFNHYNAPTKTR